MRKLPPSIAGSRLLSVVAISALGGVVGGSVAAALDVGVIEMLKKMLAVVSGQATWVLILMPLIGLALSVLVLYKFGLSSETQGLPPRTAWARAWRTFPPRAARADLTGDMVAFAGEEDRFPWRLAPIRLLSRDRYGSGTWRFLVAPAGAAVSRRGRGGRRVCAHGNSLGRHRIHS
jgi:H+/Cl- antiporter ClcA